MIGTQEIYQLRALREAFQESTPSAEWPQVAGSQVLLLADVCAALGLYAQRTEQVWL